MPVLARTIRQWLGSRIGMGASFRQDNTRDQVGGHLDADLLEAFLHRTVDDEQSQFVINHLRECDMCREVVAVAFLSVENPKAAADLELERKRRLQGEPEAWWKKGLRWTALAMAGLLLIVLVALVPQSKKPNSSASDRFGDAGTSPGVSRQSERDSFFFSSTDVRPKLATLGSDRLPPGWSMPAPYVGNVPRIPAFHEVDLSGGTVLRPNPEPAKNAERSYSRSPAFSSPMGSQPRRRLVVLPSGELRRTQDGGITWENIVVGPNLTFRSLALSGRTVWAAGSAGALFRSFDAAEHWEQVQIHDRGKPIRDDLVAIEFVDPQHGVIRTATGHEWTTVDGGDKWVLNPTKH